MTPAKDNLERSKLFLRCALEWFTDPVIGGRSWREIRNYAAWTRSEARRIELWEQVDMTLDKYRRDL